MNTAFQPELTIPSSIIQEREILLNKNSDKVFGVYNDISVPGSNEIHLELVKNALCTYKDQSVIWFEAQKDITLLDINALRKGQVEVLSGPNISIRRPVLLSGGVIEIYRTKKAHGRTRDRLLLTLREGKIIDGESYTSIAGRNIGENLLEEVEREQAEESPFLLVDSDGKYALGIRLMTPDFISHLENSITNWITKIELLLKDPIRATDAQRAENFIRKMFWRIGTLSVMIDILRDITNRKAYICYSAETIDPSKLHKKNTHRINLGTHSEIFYTHHDTQNNTYEYRKIEQVTGIPIGYTLAGRGISRLFLESIYQRCHSFPLDSGRITHMKIVPIIRAYIDSVLTKTSSDIW